MSHAVSHGVGVGAGAGALASLVSTRGGVQQRCVSAGADTGVARGAVWTLLRVSLCVRYE